MTQRFSMIRSFHLADVFTLGNAACGSGAIFLAMAYVAESASTKIYLAGALLLLAVILDVLDGRVARWRHSASPLGRELDSLADSLSFGAAPACLARAVGLSGAWDTAALVYFVTCGIGRLARYNVTADALSDESGKVAYFEGAPIPTSIVLVGMIVGLVFSGRVGDRLPGGSWTIAGGELHLMALVFVAWGSLMISKTVRIPKP